MLLQISPKEGINTDAVRAWTIFNMQRSANKPPKYVLSLIYGDDEETGGYTHLYGADARTFLFYLKARTNAGLANLAGSENIDLAISMTSSLANIRIAARLFQDPPPPAPGEQPLERLAYDTDTADRGCRG